MEKKFCLWCFKEQKKDEPGWFDFPQASDSFLCSEECFNHATIKQRGVKHLDFGKIKKHANQLLRERNRTRKSRFMDSFLAQEKLKPQDLSELFSFLTTRQKEALALTGLFSAAWSVHENPKRLMDEIEK
jgi:hypothetical protein